MTVAAEAGATPVVVQVTEAVVDGVVLIAMAVLAYMIFRRLTDADDDE